MHVRKIHMLSDSLVLAHVPTLKAAQLTTSNKHDQLGSVLVGGFNPSAK